MPNSSTVTFVISATTVTVPGPSGSTRVEQLPRCVAEPSADGTLYAYQANAVTIDRWTVDLDSLTAAQKAAFDAFFRSTAVGPLNAFAYTHTDGTTYSGVRFLNAELVWTRNNTNEWSTQVVMRVPQAVT
jgi:hypothetical protein